ncbi:hypothetical protein PIB30_017726 [Stylosanthes scabra]|uniref:Uncharacterized protein n=1 Tax=Stylosanthes scabra TaxID=79078 RepID=A0ABU6S7G4_9FABA|nr:hypothetical protein [Stylosanthes scabra]
MAEDASSAPPTQKNRRMPVSYACRRGAGRPRRGGRAGRGRGEGGDSAPTQQTQGGAFLDDLHSPGFKQLISDIMREGGSGYRPDTQFDGSPVHLDLNKPMSGPSHLFMALGGTPPSASHVPSASWDIPCMEPARLPTPPVLPAPAEQPGEPAAPGRARRAPRRRGCGTRGHMWFSYVSYVL